MAQLRWPHYLLIAIVTFVIFLPGRATLPPLDRDEPRYMEASAQMLETRNFIDVTFLNQKRYLQPAGIYWLEAAAEAVFGGPEHRHTAWPYRIPSLIAVSASVTLTAWLGALLFSPLTGLLSAALLAVSTLMAAEGRMATIDTVLLCDILLVQSTLLKVYLASRDDEKAPLRWAVAFWLSLGVGLMLKGPVVLIPAFGTIAGLWLVERRRAWWRGLRLKTGWLLTLAVVLPWCVAIGIVSHGVFFTNAVGVNFLGKIGQGQQAHGLPPGYHALIFLITFWPGSIFAVSAVPAIWSHRNLVQVRFLLCWIIPHWLIFELIATKLPHYVLPTYPAIAILTAAALTVWRPTLPYRRLFRWLLYLYGALWVVLSCAFAVLSPILLWRDHLQLAAMLLPLSLVVLGVIGAACTYLLTSQKLRAAYCAIAAAVIVHLGLFLLVVPNLKLINLAPRAADLFEAHRACGRETVLLSTSYSEPSLAFLAGANTRFPNVSGAARDLLNDPHCTRALVDIKAERAFLDAFGTRRGDLKLLGRVQGINYSNGHRLDLGLWRLETMAR